MEEKENPESHKLNMELDELYVSGVGNCTVEGP
jgi:hypothetical protein